MMARIGDLRKIKKYVGDRRENFHDVYGWAVVDKGGRQEVMLMVSLQAKLDTFPDSIAGLPVRLKRVSAPELNV